MLRRARHPAAVLHHIPIRIPLGKDLRIGRTNILQVRSLHRLPARVPQLHRHQKSRSSLVELGRRQHGEGSRHLQIRKRSVPVLRISHTEALLRLFRLFRRSAMQAHQFDPLSTRLHSRAVRSAPRLRPLIEPSPGSLPTQNLVLSAGMNDQRKPVVAQQEKGVLGQILRADPAGRRRQNGRGPR